jgi:hypothetical protein
VAAAPITSTTMNTQGTNRRRGGPESAAEEKAVATTYKNAKVPMVVSSGDEGFSAASSPAVLPSVWSVGGTVLSHTGRTWSESAWRYGSSACSLVVAKPSFQKDKLCKKRTVADVSVVADGFAVYDTFGLGEDNGWVLMSGTSLSSPLLAAMMGRAGHPSKIADPGYAYSHAKYYQDITTGHNGYCVDALCNAAPGYDAPTGIGAPRGLKGLQPPLPHEHVVLLTRLLNLHHTGEDELVWPKLPARGPDETAPLVETMERQHEDLHKALIDLQERADVWARNPASAERDALAASIDVLIPPMLDHLDTEERDLLALIDQYLTEREWADVGATAMATLPKNRLPIAFGTVLLDGEPEHVGALKAVAPGPVWFVLSRVGPSAYTRYARRLGLDRLPGAAG